MMDVDAVLSDAQIRAFASALRAVHKSDSWDYVAPFAAQGWATVGSAAGWETVRERVEQLWFDIGSE
jgi:hypothetical protein